MTSYHHLAPHYDHFFDFAGSWGKPPRDSMLAAILPRISDVCDLACGTGTTAIELAGHGLHVYAIDLSAEMCRITREKARLAQTHVTVLQADMRTFRLPEKVDLITCEFDALNHVPRKSDLTRVVKAVARALNPGGYFYFDVNNLVAFEEAWPLTWWVEKPGLALTTHGGFDPASGKASATIEIFVQQRGNNSWKRLTERVEEVCWSPQEIRAALQASGFNRIQTRDAKTFFPNDPMIHRGHRTYYLAQKA